MIESENLRTASLYINNQLLSRGLLRDGHSIDFSHPGETDGEVADTMSRIMSVVNDLILRRDRDAEHRESLSATLRTLRAESLRQANDIQRLQEKNAEAHRKVGLSDAAEASLRIQLKSAEGTIHRLKEEAARTKLLAAQTRSACATEVRKRDRQIEGLKKAVTEAARARGASKSPCVTSITVVGDIGSDAVVTFDGGSGTGSVNSDNYDLRQETNAFLAELAKGLSEENDGLLSLIRRATEQLKDMSGWDAVNGLDGEHGDGHARPLPANCVELQIEIDAVLEHLRTILTNPSFVPIEEVVVREDEINRLRDGWEKMETRWKEAVHLIDGWRKRTQANGRPINVEELKMGLRLSPVKVKNVRETEQGGLALDLDAVCEGLGEVGFANESPFDEGPLELVPAHGAEEQDDSDASSSVFDDDLDVDDLDVEEPNVEILQQSVQSSPPRPAHGHNPHISPMRDNLSSGNRGGSGSARNLRRQPNFAAITDDGSTRHRATPVEDAAPPTPPPHAEKHQSPSKRPPLSLRPVPPEEGDASLPHSAVNSTPDTSISLDSVNLARQEPEEPTVTRTTSSAPSKPPITRARTATTSATVTTQKRTTTSARPKSSQETTRSKPPSRQNVRAADDTAVKRTTPTASKDAAAAAAANPSTKKVVSRPPVTRPSKPPITRGRPDSRKGTDGASKPGARAPSTTSTGSTRSATNRTVANRTSANSESNDINGSPKRVNSRLPLPRNTPSNQNLKDQNATLAPSSNNVLPLPQQSPLTMATIQAKLAASERDADAARVRAKLRAARQAKGISLPPPLPTTTKRTVSVETSKSAGAVMSGGVGAGILSPTESSFGDQVYQAMDLDGEQDYEEGEYGVAGGGNDGYGAEDEMGMSAYRPQDMQHDKIRKREKRKSGGAADKVSSRRRSTLSPWELEQLMKGGSVSGTSQ
ncbi:Afadin and alpha-actinin-binding-domain-containing protein [Cladorrhinum samala]|uniref:Afadin and alpha-actinin-binding-domain-containing protein n=1 Tax=Cladorrhinum samala TaxID=585594 RepID=A0AAV9H8X7_9PEZI|nr:Afadin and alpha-actinin-binding-domain-containing protein [Cladorrhinum samala]